MEQRLLKFRAWHSELKVMSTEESIFDLMSYEPIGFQFRDQEGEQHFVLEGDEASKNLVIMQFTGLVDKNQQPIFEGDIVRHIEVQHRKDEHIEQVRYDEDLAGFYPFADRSFTYCDLCGFEPLDPREAEVIGNVFENPELLKEDDGTAT